MIIRYIPWLVALLLTSGVASCNLFDRLPPAQQRAKRAAEAQGDIVIGVADFSNASNFFQEGVTLAITEINQRGGVAGRRIRPIYVDDQGQIAGGQQVARQLASNPDVIAVVGHLASDVAISAAIIYEQAGIVFLSPGATDPNFTRYGGNYTFRNIPSGEEMGRQMAAFAARQKYHTMAVLYRRDDEMEKRVTDNFKAQAVALGLDIVTTKSFFDRDEDFRGMLAELKKNYAFDAIFLAGQTPAAARLIKQARDLGIPAPVLGTDGLDSPELWTVAGRAAEGTIVVTVFDPKQPTRLTRDFVNRFKVAYNVDPDTWAAQGYDALQVLAHAMEQSDSTVPLVVGSTLRFMEHWEGVTGTYGFTRTGDIVGKAVFFKVARGGGFEFLEREAETALTVDPLYVVEDITLRLPIGGDFNTLDPGLNETGEDAEVGEQLFLGLTTLKYPTYEAVPQFATDWTISADGLVYTFHLRRDVAWTDGVAVTAHDVVWAIQRNLQPALKAEYANKLYPLKNAAALRTGQLTDPTALGVRALDDFTVEFTLEHPLAYFPALAGLNVYRPLPRHVIEKYGETWTAVDHIQTNGAYRLAAWEKGMVLILRRNPTYYDAMHVAIPEVRYYTLPSSSVGLAMYARNELDLLGGAIYSGIPAAELPRIKAHPQLRQEFVSQPGLTTFLFAFNLNRPLMRNPLVRKAISAAIDRRLFVDLVRRGNGEPATTFTPPPIFGAVAPEEGVGLRFNPAQAKQWLAEAGYPDGQGFPEITILFNAGTTTSAALPPFLKQYLNIHAQLREVPWEEYAELLRQPDAADLFFIAWPADYADANSFLYDAFYPGKGQYDLGWQNAEFTAVLDKALASVDPAERKMLYRRAEQILCEEEAVVIPVFYEIASTLVKPRVKGWYNMAIGGQHIRDWALQK